MSKPARFTSAYCVFSWSITVHCIVTICTSTIQKDGTCLLFVNFSHPVSRTLDLLLNSAPLSLFGRVFARFASSRISHFCPLDGTKFIDCCCATNLSTPPDLFFFRIFPDEISTTEELSCNFRRLLRRSLSLFHFLAVLLQARSGQQESTYYRSFVIVTDPASKTQHPCQHNTAHSPTTAPLLHMTWARRSLCCQKRHNIVCQMYRTHTERVGNRQADKQRNTHYRAHTLERETGWSCGLCGIVPLRKR